MIQIFTPAKSDGARHLVQAILALGGKAIRVKTQEGLRPGGLVVNWGQRSMRMDALNSRGWFSKLLELVHLNKAGVPVPDYSNVPPLGGGWLARKNGHHEGNDLLRKGGFTPDYWTRYVELSHEFRVHVMRDLDGEARSIRVGMKFPRIASPHTWIRSWRAGWHILYNREAIDTIDSIKGVRKVAKAAIDALKLDFGAVDIGVRAKDGRPLVLEVNRAPGIEGQTLNVYALKFLQMAKAKGVA